MKKLLLLFAVATMAVSAQAQTVTESKTFDNFYVGINGGVATKATGHACHLFSRYLAQWRGPGQETG
ncbi:MAG: hypothetical protein SPL55_01650, partial [Prevotella sp.]|nr:hypothetical protein [Prevotella sp.]